ncbi:MAG: Gfo/Idh/MocA family oxidoreductase [Vicinamibacteria bacterium]
MSAPRKRLNVGLIGLGRLGRVYARDLATKIPETRLVAVSDVVEALVNDVADELGVPGRYLNPQDLVNDKNVDAVVIVTPTSAHKDHSIMATKAGKPTFCEKPPALSISQTLEMKAAINATGTFFQMGFMRRFDPGYAAAKARLTEGTIGKVVLFKSTSRDPFRTSLEYADPKSSGGMIMDMGIHDFDLARFFMGEVKSLSAIGGTLAYPELKTVGDIDNAVVSLTFANGSLGVVDLSRNGIYGYDISTELLGDAGTLRIGYLRETPLYIMTKNSVAHDTVPHFMERFAIAYTVQLQNFAQNVLQGRKPTLTIDDGVEAIRVAVAANRAYETGKTVEVATVTS